MAEPHHRGRSWLFIAAFTLILVLELGEGIDQGFDIWNWLVIVVSAVFIAQNVSRLQAGPGLR